MWHTLIDTLTQVFAPWKGLFGDSKFLETGVLSVHIVSLLVGGGFAVAADRTTLRALKREPADRARALAELGAVHRPVLIALGMLFLSGVALVTADIPTFSTSVFFLIKMTMVFLLCINGIFLALTERRLQRGDDTGAWSRLALASRFSLVLWIGTVVAGVTLGNAG